ncbi:MAG: hypothetical protein Q9174_006430, partial [Haloplaca sp. 1 TL-2023]
SPKTGEVISEKRRCEVPEVLDAHWANGLNVQTAIGAINQRRLDFDNHGHFCAFHEKDALFSQRNNSRHILNGDELHLSSEKELATGDYHSSSTQPAILRSLDDVCNEKTAKDFVECPIEGEGDDGDAEGLVDDDVEEDELIAEQLETEWNDR